MSSLAVGDKAMFKAEPKKEFLPTKEIDKSNPVEVRSLHKCRHTGLPTAVIMDSKSNYLEVFTDQLEKIEG